MKWKKWKIETTVDSEDIIISALDDLGFEGAQIEDKVPLTAAEKERMFVDIPLQPEEDDGSAVLSFYIPIEEDGTLIWNEEKTDEAVITAGIREALKEVSRYADIGTGLITVEETEDVDWVNNWKQYFHSFRIGDLQVVPTWEEEETSEGEKVLRIDPGMAFGTGAHETTKLCIQGLQSYLKPGMNVLDIGTGSGILGIVSLLYGASHVNGTDLDECVEEAVAQNCQENGIAEDNFNLYMGNVITEKALRTKLGQGCYDIVTANILAEVLVQLTPCIPDFLTKGGIYITSGILEGKKELVADAMRKVGLEVLSVNKLGEWVCVVGRYTNILR
jgi:ribosomal protein L11 methyltransferase